MLPAHKLKDVTMCKQLKHQLWTAEPSDALDVYGNLLLVPNSQLSKGGLVCQKLLEHEDRERGRMATHRKSG